MAILQGARITGSIIATTFIKANGFSGSITASNLYVLGKAGIGTTSPSNTNLHIVGDWISGHSTVKVQGLTDNTTGYGFYNTVGSRLGYIAYTGTGFEWYNNESVPTIFYTNTSEKMRITSGGDVGINTSSPGRPLEVKSTNIAIRMNNTSNTNAGLEYYVSTGTYFNWVLGAQYNVSDGFEITPSTAAGGTTYSSPKFVVKANGNVGIGTTSPASRLDVSGSINTNNGLNISRGNIGFTTDTTEFFIKTTMNGGAIRFRGNSGAASDRNVQLGNVDNNGNWTSYLIAEGGGNVGIGTTSPSTNLHIGGTAASGGASGALGVFLSRGVTTNFFEAFDGTKSFIAGVDNTQGFAKVGTLSNHPVSITQNNGSAIYIDTSANVGINTTSPSTKLEVVGTITCTTMVETSSVATKTNVKKLTSQTAKIAKLSPVSFNYKNNNKRSLGLIAEEVAQVYPELVEYDNGQPLGVNYSKLTSVLISAVNELAAELAELKKQLNK